MGALLVKHIAWVPLVFCAVSPQYAFAQEMPGAPDWVDPEVSSRGVERVSTALLSYASMEEALRLPAGASPYAVSLDGPWYFLYSDSADSAPWDMGASGLDALAWDSVDVPGCWQLQGHGGPMQAPAVPDGPGNEIGTYRRSFGVPPDWKERLSYLRFERVDSAFYVWVNGEQVGYSESPGVNTFDITPYVAPGENDLVVQVVRWSDSRGYDSENRWNLSGITGTVELCSVPRVHIRDVSIRTVMQSPFTRATLEATVDVRSVLGMADAGTLRAELYDAAGTRVFESPFVEDVIAAPGRLTRLTLRAPVPHVQPWTAETPYLYNLVLELTDGAGNGDVRRVPVGFRTAEVSGGLLRVNGRPITVRGVAYTPWDADLGLAVSDDALRRDVASLKAHNFNAVRVPMGWVPPRFLELCDEFGLYVAAETPDLQNLDQREWRGRVVDRIQQSIGQGRNHPSLTLWAVSGDAAARDLAQVCIDTIRQADLSRPIAVSGLNGVAGADIILAAHPGFGESDSGGNSYANGLPVLWRTLARSSGNSLGGLARVWEDVRATPSLQGGFVVEWSDRTLRRRGYWETRDSARPDRRVFVLGDPSEGRLTSGTAFCPSSTDLDILGNKLTLRIAMCLRDTASVGVLVGKGSQFAIRLTEDAHLQFEAGGEVVRTPIEPSWIETWRSVECVFDGSTLRIAVDGEALAEKACESTLQHDSAVVVMGNLHPEGCGIDDVRIFDRLPAEIDDAEDKAASEAIMALDFEDRTWVEREWLDRGALHLGNERKSCTQGLVTAMGSPKPALWECKKIFEPLSVTVDDVEAGKVTVHNRNDHLSLEQFTSKWKLYANDFVIEEGTVQSLRGTPGQSQSVWIPFSTPRPRRDVIHRIDMSFERIGEADSANSGEVAWAQMLLTPRPARTSHGEFQGPPRVQESQYAIDVLGPEFRMTFSKAQGIMTRWESNGIELISVGPELNLWRAPTDNDVSSSADVQWRERGLNEMLWRLESISARTDGGEVLVQAAFRFHASDAVQVLHTIRYRINGAGAVQADGRVTTQAAVPYLPRLGLQLFVPQVFRNLRWWGRGPHETYPDRKASGRLGEYAEVIDRTELAYSRPQEFGNKSDVYYAALLDDAGTGIAIETDDPVNCSAYPYLPQHLEETPYSFALEPADTMTWNIDFDMAPLGTGSDSERGTRADAAKTEWKYTVVFHPVQPN